MMLNMSQTSFAHALGLSLPQVHKYERGTNHIGASRLEQISRVLQVPIAFFFDGAPGPSPIPKSRSLTPTSDPLTDFMATHEGLTLARAFMQIDNVRLRRRIAELVEQIDENRNGPAVNR
jgi:transcriptional regulator with XRE-family HTH domain